MFRQQFGCIDCIPITFLNILNKLYSGNIPRDIIKDIYMFSLDLKLGTSIIGIKHIVEIINCKSGIIDCASNDFYDLLKITETLKNGYVIVIQKMHCFTIVKEDENNYYCFDTKKESINSNINFIVNKNKLKNVILIIYVKRK